MIEPIMFFGIGFLVASLLGLVFIPLVHGRAVRLTLRRLEASTPLSMAEIQADKDQLRAEFAMSTRRLEMIVEQLKTKTTSQFAELGKKNDAINRLKLELDEKTASLFALEAREKALKEQVRTLETEYSLRHTGMHEAQRTLADKETEFAKLSHELSARTVTSDTQEVEIVALRTQIDALKTQLEDYEHQVSDTRDRLERKRSESDATTQMLAGERGKVDALSSRAEELERQLTAQTVDAAVLGQHVRDLEARLGEQGRLLAQRESETAELRAALEAARKAESELRAEIAAVDARHAAATQALRADKEQAQTLFAQERDERTRAQHELAALRKEAEETWATERVETALLRERLNDVAAEMARMTMALEGPESPIQTILASETARPRGNGGGRVNGEHNGNGNGHAETGTLAERIRALHARAARRTNPS